MKLLRKIIGDRPYERFIRKIGRVFKTHVKIRKLSAWSSEDLRTVSILNHYGITSVIDIGANIGQFAESLIDYGYKGRIVSFEPTSVAHKVLSKKAASHSNWEIAEKCAIGDFDEEIEINVAENTVFSSIKTIHSDYVDYNDESKIINKEKVQLFKLDSIRNRYLMPDEKVFLKIDTQGFEREVLDGATETLKHVKGIKIEAPLLSIYNDSNWGVVEMLNFFSSKQFKCISISEVGVNKSTGIVYEVDMILIKEDLINSHPKR